MKEVSTVNAEGPAALDARGLRKPTLTEMKASFGDLEEVRSRVQDNVGLLDGRNGQLVLDENIREESENTSQVEILEQKIEEKESDIKGSAAETMIGGFALTGFIKFGLIASAKLLVAPFLVGRFFRMLDLDNENKIARGEEPKNTELIKYGKAAAMLSYFGYGLNALTPLLIPLHLSLWQLYIIMGVVGGIMYGLYKLGRHLPSLLGLYKKFKNRGNKQ